MQQQIDIEDRLEDLVVQKVTLLRDILANLSQEQQALMAHDVERLNPIIQERLQFLDAYEKCEAKSLVSIQELANLEKKSIPSLQTLTSDEVLEILQTLVRDDNLELHSRLDQLKALHKEFSNKNNITRYFLEKSPRESVKLKKKKVALDLMEPE